MVLYVFTFRECFQCSIIIIDLSVSLFFFFKQKTAYEMRISDWSSDVCSSDLWRQTEIRSSLLNRPCLQHLPVARRDGRAARAYRSAGAGCARRAGGVADVEPR